MQVEYCMWVVTLWTECSKVDTKRKSLNSPNLKVMEKNHTRAKTINASSATNVVEHLTLGMNVQLMPSAIPVEKKVTTSLCAVQAKLYRA